MHEVFYLIRRIYYSNCYLKAQMMINQDLQRTEEKYTHKNNKELQKKLTSKISYQHQSLESIPGLMLPLDKSFYTSQMDYMH